MRVLSRSGTITLLPTDEEVKDVCKIGQQESTCTWLACGAAGFECLGVARPAVIEERLRNGTMNAKRDGCDVINSLDILKYLPIETEITIDLTPGK